MKTVLQFDPESGEYLNKPVSKWLNSVYSLSSYVGAVAGRIINSWGEQRTEEANKTDREGNRSGTGSFQSLLVRYSGTGSGEVISLKQLRYLHRNPGEVKDDGDKDTNPTSGEWTITSSSHQHYKHNSLGRSWLVPSERTGLLESAQFSHYSLGLSKSRKSGGSAGMAYSLNAAFWAREK
jgi:hypothetical protein